MRKPVVSTEAAYAVGLVLLALGTALTERGGYGISMVVAPAYILHLKMSASLPWFSFGVAEYLLQALVLAAMMLLLKKRKPVCLLSFATAVLYGLILDGAMALVQPVPVGDPGAYVCGVLLCCAGISLLFRTYLPPAAYEMFVKKIAEQLHCSITVCKTVYDCCSLVAAVGLSLAFFGELRGIGVGTVICALFNGVLIRGFSRLFDGVLVFRDRFALRTIFEEREEPL